MTDLIKTDTKLGEGAEAQAGQTVIVHYTGWLYDESAPENKGKKFDSSLDRNEPFDFPLGGGRVIKGWDEGVQGMKEGGQPHAGDSAGDGLWRRAVRATSSRRMPRWCST